MACLKVCKSTVAEQGMKPGSPKSLTTAMSLNLESVNCLLDFISFRAAAQSHLEEGVRTDFRYERLLLD